MPPSDADHTGARIADYRKLRHLTQQGLAQRAYVSYSSLTKVEAGLSPASPELVAAVARVLRVPVAVLNGQPYISQMRQDKIDGLISPLADALYLYDLGDPQITPRPVTQLAEDADELCRLAFDSADYGTLGNAFPSLLGELSTALHTASTSQARPISGALAKTYLAAEIFAYRLGYHDLATIALERAGWAAEQAQDPLLLALRMSRRSQVLLERGNASAASRVAARGSDLVDQADEPRAMPAMAVAGALHLRRALVAGRAKDQETALGHIAQGREIAKRVGEVPHVYWAAFGPTNVIEYEMNVRVTLDQPSEVVRASKSLHFAPGHPHTWKGSDFIVVARAFTRMGRNDKALNALAKAWGAAPQQVRYSPVAREVVGALVRRFRQLPDSLSSLAAKVGM